MNYQSVVSELLLALRGKRKTAELSKALGFKYNKVHRWESGEKQLRWDEFCNYCKILDIPISKILRDIFKFDQPDPLKFLKHLYENRFPRYTVQSLSEQMHRHPSAIRRYLDGETFPDLEFVLAFIDSDVNRLSVFLSSLLPANSDSPLRAKVDLEFKKMNSLGEYPMAAAIEMWLVTKDYLALPRHDSSFIANRVGSSAQQVDHILELMLSSETVKRLDNGKYAPTFHAIETAGIDAKLICKMFHHWHSQAAHFYTKGSFDFQGSAPCRGAMRVAPVSREVSQKINEVIVRTEAEIRDILEKGPESYDDVRVILLGTFSTLDFS